MFEDIVLWIYAAGIFQAIFLAVSLITLNIRNRAAVYALSVMMLLMVVALGEQFADTSGASRELALSLALEFGLAPLLFIFIRSIASPGWRPTLQTTFHFAPMALALCGLALMHANNAGGNLGITHPQFGNLIIAWVFVKLGYFAAYAVVTERILRCAVADAKPARAASLRWIHRWLLVVIAAFVTSYLIFILFIAGAPIWSDSDVYAGIIMFAVIFSIAYFVLANRKALDLPPQKTTTVTTFDIQNAEKINTYFLSRHPHCEAEFSIESLASATQLSIPAIQAAIAHLTGGGFQEYVNTLRLEEFDVLARVPENKAKTTLELAYAAGFNSKATFYRVFNAEKGMTPRLYRENLEIA